VSISTTREQRRQLARDNLKLPSTLQLVPRDEWPTSALTVGRLRVWRSRRFLVQEFRESAAVVARLSINRTTLGTERWADNITWDELQDIKAQCGYAEHDAVEVYPMQRDVVNVANMRHLWVLASALPFAWRTKGRAG
jgi:hypothetical protein